MAKRLTPFIGLAVVAALALAAAFGAFSLTPAFAGVEEPNARGLAPAVDFQSQVVAGFPPAPAIQLETTAANTPRTDIVAAPTDPAVNLRMYKGETVTIDLKDSINNTAAAITTGGNPLLDAWEIRAPAAGDDADGNALPNVVTFTPTSPSSHEEVSPIYTHHLNQGGSTSTEVTITANSSGSVLLTITAIDYQSTETDGTDRYANSTYTFTVSVGEATLVPSSTDPGARARYRVEFTASTNMSTGEEIAIKLEDFRFPGSANADSVTVESDAYYVSETDVRATDAEMRLSAAKYQAGVVNPTSAYVDGDEMKVTVPDMNPETDRADNIRKGDRITIVIQQGAGIANPTEGNQGGIAEITNTVDTVNQKTAKFVVTRLVELSEEDGGRGTTVTATGKGFKNGTSLGFFLDADGDGVLDAGETRLCDVATVGSNDTGSCDFTVSNPPFDPGFNFVNAVDGRGQYATEANNDDQRFELKPSISATPSGGNPGDTILVQGTDFPDGGSLSSVLLARQTARDLKTAQGLNASVGANGDMSFRFTVPDWAIEGVQDLKVVVTFTNDANEADEADDNINVTIGGPVVTSTPKTVLPNQRISLVGTGFSSGSRITGDQDNDDADPSITIGGYVIPDRLINDGDPVTVDNGGKWSASVDLPLRSVTTRDGEREIRITDSSGRSGTVKVTIPARVVSIDPPTGRIGTEATIRGENFPSKNNNGESFNIQIIYDPGGNRETQVSTVSDASGRFETKIRIPTGATIPSTNPVRVTFTDEQEIDVTTTVSHEVPEGSVTLSANSGLPGNTITLRGEGFEAFVPVRSVKVGSIEVTPSPAPSTDALGQMKFDILIPGLDTGIQTIEVQVSDTTASIGFTVQSGAIAGAVTPVAEGVADMGDNFIRAFNFDNDSKTWTFYDPAAGDASTMANFVAGSSYWILVGSTADAILNRETRTLTCANNSCWNLIVW